MGSNYPYKALKKHLYIYIYYTLYIIYNIACLYIIRSYWLWSRYDDALASFIIIITTRVITVYEEYNDDDDVDDVDVDDDDDDDVIGARRPTTTLHDIALYDVRHVTRSPPARPLRAVLRHRDTYATTTTTTAPPVEIVT